MTREQIELCLATADEGAQLTKALCTLALRALRYEAVNPADFRYWEGRYRDEAADNDRLRAENERLRAAISWIEPPFVDSKTSEAELRTRIRMCVEDKRRALERKPE